MRTKSFWPALAVTMIGLFAMHPPVFGQDGTGWKFPNLNPFRGKSEPTRAVGELSDAPPRTGWRMPTLPKPSLPKFMQRSNEDPTMTPQRPLRGNVLEGPEEPRFQPLKKINQGARGIFTTARNTVTRPFTRNREERPPTSVPATREGPRGSFFRRAPATAETNDQPQEIRTAQDFLKLPRVK